MNTRACVETLTSRGDIPDDSEVVSTNNKIVVISRQERLVARIASLTELKVRDDPHDLRYSHTAAWLAGDSAPVVKPLQEQPVVSGDYMISNYPMLNVNVELDKSRANDVYTMTRGLGEALPTVEAGMTLRRLNVATYVQERLDHMLNDPTYDQRLVEYVQTETHRMGNQYPFEQLTQRDTSLVHGDFKADNIVADHEGSLKAIDLDAVAVGPGLYDLASWRLRSEMGDSAPIEEVANVGRQTDTWDEEAYTSLIGWKAISSMSFTLRYETPDINREKIPHIAESAVVLGGLVDMPPYFND